MSFLKNLKKSLGFDGADDSLLQDDAPETTVNDDVSTSYMIKGAQRETKPGDDTTIPIVDRTKVDMIFATVVEQFNQALPNFLQGSVNAEAQRKQLYDSLDTSIKNYFNSVAEEIRKRCENHIADEQTSLRNEISVLQAKTKQIEQQRFDIKQQQLSADRQKRALTDRLQDLESQIGRLEAEREQFDLENKSLLNKVKVSAVHEAEIETLQQQIADTKAENQRLRLEGVSDETNNKIKHLTDEVESLQNQLEQAREKDRIATEMMNGLQSKASQSRQEAEALTEKLTAANAEIETLNAKLKEAETSREEIDKINEQLNQVEELINTRDQKIKKLKDLCQSLRNDNESLQQTIAANIKTHAESEANLNETIDVLNARIAELEAEPLAPIDTDALDREIDNIISTKSAENETVKISESDLRAIEESFDTADWMRSDPPQTQSMRANLPEDDFGYQAPVKKSPRPDNDAQLTLF